MSTERVLEEIRVDIYEVIRIIEHFASKEENKNHDDTTSHEDFVFYEVMTQHLSKDFLLRLKQLFYSNYEKRVNVLLDLQACVETILIRRKGSNKSVGKTLEAFNENLKSLLQKDTGGKEAVDQSYSRKEIVSNFEDFLNNKGKKLIINLLESFSGSTMQAGGCSKLILAMMEEGLFLEEIQEMIVDRYSNSFQLAFNNAFNKKLKSNSVSKSIKKIRGYIRGTNRSIYEEQISTYKEIIRKLT